MSHPLASFPAIAAALLKSKKHEWILFAFEANKCVRLLWFNKGPDRNSVAPLLRDYEIVDAAVTLAVSTVLCFHNHPNAVLTASDQDLRSAAHWSELLTQKGVNLIEFVCGRGEFVEYFRSIADAFLPVDQFAQAIRFTNGITKSRNFTLHLERLF
ncbi:MAG: hypothetical protein HYX72_09170 [Acidobacteria bacterium]|nr:hypothetical protein [Acidobacteriota bacterium]